MPSPSPERAVSVGRSDSDSCSSCVLFNPVYRTKRNNCKSAEKEESGAYGVGESCLPRTIVLRFLPMPRQTEPNANNALGILLQGMMHGCNVRSENVRSIVGHPGLQPDTLITEFESRHNRRPPDTVEQLVVKAAGASGKRLRYADRTAAQNSRLSCRTCCDGVQTCVTGKAT